MRPRYRRIVSPTESGLVISLLLAGALAAFAVAPPAAKATRRCASRPSQTRINNLTATKVSCAFALRLARDASSGSECYPPETVAGSEGGCSVGSFDCVSVSDSITESFRCTASHGRRVRWGKVA